MRLTIYDLLGRQVALLTEGVREAGFHEIVFDGRNLAAGVYLYRLETDHFKKTKKLLLLK